MLSSIACGPNETPPIRSGKVVARRPFLTRRPASSDRGNALTSTVPTLGYRGFGANAGNISANPDLASPCDELVP